MNRYIIEYESSQWCGGVSHCVAYANSKEEALMAADVYMEEDMRELFSGEYEEEESYDQECAYNVNSIAILDENHEHWQFYINPSQSQFYPEVNSND